MVFVAVFKQQGVDISLTEARGPMGKAKKDHIRELTTLPAITDRWRQTDGVEAVTLVSEGTATMAYDLALADEATWLSVMEAVGACGGRVETYHRVDDQSLRRIVAHFSNGLLEGEGDGAEDQT